MSTSDECHPSLRGAKLSDKKVLVVASEPLTADRLRAALGSDDAGDVEVLVVAPALHASGLRFWLSDADEAIGRARWVADTTVEELHEAGVDARGDTGEGESLDAIADVLVTFPAERILLFARPKDEQRYKEEIASGELRERFGVEIEQIPAAVRPAEG